MTRDQLIAEVQRRKAAGETYTVIAEALKIPRSQAHKFANYEEREANSHARIRRRKFIAGISQGLNQTQAAIKAGVKKEFATVWASRAMKSTAYQRDFHKMLESQGLSEQALAQKHAALLKAKKTVFFQFEGEVTDQRTVDDNSTQIKAVELGWQVFGRTQNAEIPRSSQVNVLIGIPNLAVPEGATIDVESGPENGE